MTTPCGNLVLEKADTSIGNDHCEVECEEGYYLKNNTLLCTPRGSPLAWTWGQFVGSAACEAVSCGVPPVVPMATYSHGVVHYGPEGHVTYTCMSGHNTEWPLSTDRRSFTVACQANGTFTPLSSCLPVSCGAAPTVSHAVPSAETGVFNDVIVYTVEPGFAATDGFNATAHDMYIGRRMESFLLGLVPSLSQFRLVVPRWPFPQPP